MFSDNQFEFPGKYKTMVLELSKKSGVANDSSINIFERVIDCLFYSAAIGIKNNLLSPANEVIESDTNPVSVFPEQMIKNRETINFLYEIAMLTYKFNDPKKDTDEERLKRAFKYPNTKDKTPEEVQKEKEDDQIFKRYIFGGLQYIYDYFKELIDAKTGRNPHRSFSVEDLDMRILEFLTENIDEPLPFD